MKASGVRQRRDEPGHLSRVHIRWLFAEVVLCGALYATDARTPLNHIGVQLQDSRLAELSVKLRSDE